MKIVLLNTQAPYIRGGAEYLVESLKIIFEECCHSVDIVNVPFRWYPPNVIPKQLLGACLLRLDALAPDLVIAHKFPAYYVPYPRKKLWLFHQFRQAYDLWGTPYQDIPNTPEGRRIRDMIINMDNLHLQGIKEIYTNSKIVARRLNTYNQIEATRVLYPPLLRPEMYHCGEFGSYFFYPSRITASKRQIMAIEAMKHIKSNFRLVLAGTPDSSSYGKELKQLITRLGVQKKVTMLGWISEHEKASLMSNAYASLYLPYNEDSYGFVTLEAFHSHKPVIVFKDSGGTDEIVSQDFNGLILDPTPEALAEGMEYLWSQRRKTSQMGENAYQTLAMHNINWNYVVENLLQ